VLQTPLGSGNPLWTDEWQVYLSAASVLVTAVLSWFLYRVSRKGNEAQKRANELQAATNTLVERQTDLEMRFHEWEVGQASPVLFLSEGHFDGLAEHETIAIKLALYNPGRVPIVLEDITAVLREAGRELAQGTLVSEWETEAGPERKTIPAGGTRLYLVSAHLGPSDRRKLPDTIEILPKYLSGGSRRTPTWVCAVEQDAAAHKAKLVLISTSPRDGSDAMYTEGKRDDSRGV
jgi:hypothetical protein